MFIFQAGTHLTKQSAARFPSGYPKECIQFLRRHISTEECKEQKKPLVMEKSEPPKPPPKDRCIEPPKDEGNSWSKKLFAASCLALGGTALVVYGAKNDDDFRDWTKEHVPVIDKMVKVAYQEEETYGEFLMGVHKDATEGLKLALYNVIVGIRDAGKKTTKDSRVDEPPRTKKSSDVFKFPPSAFAIEDEDSNLKVPEKYKHLKELEDKLFRDAREALKIQQSAADAIKESAKFIDNLEQMISKHDCKLWERYKKRKDELKALSEMFDKAQKKVEDSAEYLKFQMDRTPDLTSDVREKAENNINFILDSVDKAKDTLNKDISNQGESRLSSDKMRVARMYFYDQLETYVPNLNIDDEKLILPVSKMEPFIESVLQNILIAEKDLIKFQTIIMAEVNSVLEKAKRTHPDLPTDDIIHAFVMIESEKEKRLQRELLQKSLNESKAKCEKDNRESLRQLTDVYSDLKAEALTVREREVERRLQQQLEKALADQRGNYQMEMAKMVGRIQGANEAIASRGEKEKGEHGKQQFWSAAQTLVSSIKPIGTSNKSKGVRPIKNEVLNVKKAAPEGDELVKSVVDSIPSDVIEQGVASEECLKRRFLQVEKEARHLASVPSGQITLFQLALARIQSALYVNTPIPESELKNEPIDVEELNNYQLLQRARYYVNQGDLEQAAKYLNLLKGPSEVAVSDWVKDVLAYKETLQAAEVLLAYASAYNE